MKKPEKDIKIILDLLRDQFGDAISEPDESCTPVKVMINSDSLLEIAGFLHADERCYFDQLSCLSGIDNGPEEGTMEVIYNLYSIPNDLQLMLGVKLETRSEPVIDSVCGIWKTANWHERETFDLLGIRFRGHPDLRRILLPADWVGHPLKKDYEVQGFYHGVKVEYEE